jgi:uncharacterized protein
LTGADILLVNLMSPIVLAIYLLFSIGLTGGRELSKASLTDISGLLGVAILLTIVIPIVTYAFCRRVGGLDIANAAAVAAHYGSVSSVTFFAAVAFAKALNTPSEAYLTAVVALMEWAVIISLMIARWAKQQESGASILSLVKETLRGRGILLLTGGMVIGAVATDSQWTQISPFYEGLFRGFLMLFLLEMGMTAARQAKGYAAVGRFMTVFALVSPLVWGLIGITLGWSTGLSLGGAFVLGAVCASSSYIDAPAACRAALPEANPGIYLTASLGVTFPFNLLIGLPLYYQFARWLYGQ